MKKGSPETNKFECTLFKEKDMSDEGTLIYSKEKTGKFPHDF